MYRNCVKLQPFERNLGEFRCILSQVSSVPTTNIPCAALAGLSHEKIMASAVIVCVLQSRERESHVWHSFPLYSTVLDAERLWSFSLPIKRFSALFVPFLPNLTSGLGYGSRIFPRNCHFPTAIISCPSVISSLCTPPASLPFLRSIDFLRLCSSSSPLMASIPITPRTCSFQTAYRGLSFPAVHYRHTQ